MKLGENEAIHREKKHTKHRFPWISSLYSKDCNTPLCELKSDFNYIKPIANKLNRIIKKYDFADVVTAVFCLNSWRRNRSALAQGLSLNLALSNITVSGPKQIKNYEELKAFYNDISFFLNITFREDYTLDDFGEVFINHQGKTYPIIIGTGHQQVYGVMRYMQVLASICDRDNELTVILEYLKTIIESTKKPNIPSTEEIIIFELPSEEYWLTIKNLFGNPHFKSQILAASQIMGYQYNPIEMRHFIKKTNDIFPLFNTSLLIDYYKILLFSATPEEKDAHITRTILSLIENSYNSSSNSPNRILLKPIIIDRNSNQQIVSNGLLFAGIIKNHLLIAADKRSFNDMHKIRAVIQQINQLVKAKSIRLAERYYRKKLHGGYGLDINHKVEIVFIVVDPFTDITSHGYFLSNPTDVFECTALDLLYLFGFSESLEEVVDFILYDQVDKTQIFAFGGKSQHFFAWKKANRHISSGAIEYDGLTLDYNGTDEFTYSYFRSILCEFPHNSTKYFSDPLNWTVETSSFGFNRMHHKGCLGFGGEIKALGPDTYLLLAHNIEFFTESDLSQDAHTALKTVDELNQRLSTRYADIICSMPILSGKTLQLLFMPWQYATENHIDTFLNDASRTIVFSDEYIDTDIVIIRYSVDPKVLLAAIQNAADRKAENTYFEELLQPLYKYSPIEYKNLSQKLLADASLKKTVGVFNIEQYYYYSDKALDTKISAVSFAKARKEIAKVCLRSGVEPGKYLGKEATAAIRNMQASVVEVFEKHIADFDLLDLHKKALNYYSVQQHGVILNLKRYSAFKDLDDEVQKEFERNTRDLRERYRRNVRTAEYLLESNLSVTHSRENKPCLTEDFEFLLAFADWLVVLQDSADTCYYTDFDITVSVDSEYKLDTFASEASQNDHDTMVIRKYRTKGYDIKDDSVDLDYFKKAIAAFTQDTGIDIGLLTSLLEYLQLSIIQEGLALEIYPNVFEVDVCTLVHNFHHSLTDNSITADTIKTIIDFLTINPTTLKTINGTKHNILPIWEREKRDNRFNTKPILVQNGKCIFSPISMHYVLTSWKSGIAEWYLPYETGLPKLKAILKQWKKRYEDQMVQDVVQAFRDAKFDLVIPEADLVHRFPKDNYPAELGDYDVIAINKAKQEIWIIESKVLQKVGSIFEDQMQQKSFFYQHKSDEKFQRRIDYMVQNTDKVLTSFGINNATYKVIPYMVTNKLFASRYKKISFPIVTYYELMQLLEENFQF